MGRAQRGIAVDGILLLDKPVGMTSNAALQAARRLLDARKAGHTGTLDPLCSGLLPIACGEAAKFAFGLLDADKRYDATLQLGVTTTTGDAEGDELARRPVAASAEAIDAVLSSLVGNIAQVPPMHSALKHQGRPLYRYARDGIEVERAPRTVTIRRLARTGLDDGRLRIEVECSKGTYVRVLAADIGERLGCGAHLAALRRTRVGPLDVVDAVTLAGLEALAPDERARRLLPPDVLLEGLPRLELDAEQASRLRQGQRLALGAGPAPCVRTYDDRGRLIGVAEVDADGVVAPRRLVTEIRQESESQR